MPETVDRARWPDVASANRSARPRMPARRRRPQCVPDSSALRAPSAIAVSGLLLLSACSGTRAAEVPAPASPAVARRRAERAARPGVERLRGRPILDRLRRGATRHRRRRSSSATPTPTSSPRWRAAARPTSSTSTRAGSSSTSTQGSSSEIDTSKLTNWDAVPARVPGARADRRQAVLHPVGLGLHLDPLQHRAGRRGHQLGRPVQRGVRRPHLDVERRPGRRDRLVLHPRLGRDGHHR